MTFPTKKEVRDYLKEVGAINRSTSKMSREIKDHFGIPLMEATQSRFNRTILHRLKAEKKICMEKFPDKDSIGRTVKQLHCWVQSDH